MYSGTRAAVLKFLFFHIFPSPPSASVSIHSPEEHIFWHEPQLKYILVYSQVENSHYWANPVRTEAAQ